MCEISQICMAGETTGLVFSHISRISRRKWDSQIAIKSDAKPIVVFRVDARGLIFGKSPVLFCIRAQVLWWLIEMHL